MKKYGKQYPEVWTKEPHGGAYHKAGPAPAESQALVCTSGSGKAELGYETQVLSRTSNFVGNHMTQGAIDLVQNELKPKSAKSGNTGAQVLRLMPFASPEPHLLRDGNADDQGPGGSGDVSAGDNADDGSGLPAGGGGGGSRGYGALAAPVVATVPPSPGIAGKFPELRSMARSLRSAISKAPAQMYSAATPHQSHGRTLSAEEQKLGLLAG